MDRSALERRALELGVLVINLIKGLPYRIDTAVIGKQLIRSSTSVGANYRAALRARSKAEFYAKLCIVVEEADETCYWLEVMQRANVADAEQLQVLRREAEILTKIFSASRKTARQNLNSPEAP